jgi:hypothetical protein
MSGGIHGFIRRWKASGGSEQANSQPFLLELCDALAPSKERLHNYGDSRLSEFHVACASAGR